MAALAVGLCSIAASAASSGAKVDRQAYYVYTAVNPYSSTDTDLHVAVTTGSAAAETYVHLDFSAVPNGAEISALQLTMTQDSSTGTSANAQAAQLHACVLTQPLAANYDGSKQLPSDCKRGDAGGQLDSAGHWTFNLQSLVGAWDALGNTGAAILPIVQPPIVGSAAGTTATSWSIGLIPVESKGTVTYTTPSTETQQQAQPAPVVPVMGLATQPAPLPVVPPLPPPVVAAASAPSAGTVAGPAPLPQGIVPVTRIETSATWLRVAGGLALVAVLLVLVGVAGQLVGGGRWSPVAIAAALGRSRAQMATPVAVILVGAVLAGGFASRSVTIGLPGQAAAGGPAGSQAGGGSSPVPGSSPLLGQPGGATGGGSTTSSGGPRAPGDRRDRRERRRCRPQLRPHHAAGRQLHDRADRVLRCHECQHRKPGRGHQRAEQHREQP